MSAVFSELPGDYVRRIDDCLEAALPAAQQIPRRLHEAMRYAVLSGGKRVRPQLVYATGECLQIAPAKLDPLAVAVELIHAFSLIHDDLPAMDNDDLRRGQPTVHRAFDEATAILAADALQPLAFQIIGGSDALSDREKVAAINTVTAACGSLGMTGGQSIDLASEGKVLSGDQLRQLHSLKTGALLRASVVASCEVSDAITAVQKNSLTRYAEKIGLAFQIRDDILDVEGDSAVLGKRAGADQRLAKATWPSVFGMRESKDQCRKLLDESLEILTEFGETASSLRWLARYIVDRVA